MDYSKIKKGDILYESSYNLTIEVKVISDPIYVEIPEGERSAPCEIWRISFTAESGNGEIEYNISPIGLMYNCGRFSYYPEYSGQILRLNGKWEEQNVFQKAQTKEN
jgi:hypothetical protein